MAKKELSKKTLKKSFGTGFTAILHASHRNICRHSVI